MTKRSLRTLGIAAGVVAAALGDARTSRAQSPTDVSESVSEAAVAPLAPPGPTARDPRDPNARVYECPGMDAVVASVRVGVVALFLTERTLILTRDAAAVGDRYSDGDVSLFVTHDEILLELGDQPVRCSENRGRSLWEDAKLRGIDYRAVGNEPGWVLEIGPEWITFDYDYGTANAIFPALEPIVDATNRRTVYAGESPNHEVQITVGIGPCRDTMADEVYDTSTEVVLDGRTFQGCGRALH